MSKFLIVDSDINTISGIKSLILKYDSQAKLSYISDEFLNLNQVINILPDYIFINVDLQNQDGIIQCQILKKSPTLAHIPLILYGNNLSRDKYYNNIAESGAFTFLSLPFDELNFQLLIKSLQNLNFKSETIHPDITTINESLYNSILEKMPYAVYKSTPDGKFTEVNEALVKMLGYASKEELLAINIKTGLYFNAEDLEIALLQVKNEEKRIIRLRKKDGTVLWVENHSWHILDEDGEILLYEGIIRDITESRNAENTITEERILLRTLINIIPDPIYVKDASGRKLISNIADFKLIGYQSEEEVIGKTDLELLSPEVAQQTYSDDLSVIKNGKPIYGKIEYVIDPQGIDHCLSTTKLPLTNESGEIIGLVGVGHDITNQKINEQKIIQLSKGIEQSPASIIITDTLGNIEYVNQKFIEISGYSFEEIKGKNPRIFQSGLTKEKDYEKLWQSITSGKEYRSEILNKKRNGELFWESVLISPIRDESGKIVNYMAIKEDITRRKKADLEILKLSFAIEQNPASIIITNTDGIIEYVNQKFTTISGYSNEELLGRTIRILTPGHTTEDVYIEIWNNLLAGKDWKGEQLNRKKNKETYWESVLISPIKNSEKKVTNFVIMSEDISERKKMEKDLVAAKEKAVESDHLKSAFLANMSHEIRTPLNSILGFSDLLTASDLNQVLRNEYSNLINLSGNNLLAIINDILDISKIEAGQLVLMEKRFSANKIVSEIQQEYSYKAISKGIELKISEDCSKEEIFLFSDEARIKQILINFVGNALKFTQEGYIEIGVKLIDQSIKLHVKDTGIGISKEFHDKIFERFRQVESAETRKYGGNGLGLAITKNLAQMLGGRIELDSEISKGATFSLIFPIEIKVN